MKRNLLLLLFASAIVHAQQLRVDAETSFITYEASHPVHDWSGTSNEVQGVMVLENDIPKRIAVVTPVSAFDSKNSNRDAHAAEVLEALLFPKVSFYSDEITLDGDVLTLKGALKFHGVSLPLAAKANWIKQTDKWVLEGAFDVQPSKFDIKLPSFMLVKMRDNLSIGFRLELRTFVP